MDRVVAVDADAIRTSGVLGVFRRDSGWDEWQDDPRYPNQQWRMEEVFARGRELHAATAPSPASTSSLPPRKHAP